MHVSLRQNDGSWDHEILIDGELAGADCALGTINNQLVTAYTRGTALGLPLERASIRGPHPIDGENGDVVGQGLDLVIHNDRAYIAHRNDVRSIISDLPKRPIRGKKCQGQRRSM